MKVATAGNGGTTTTTCAPVLALQPEHPHPSSSWRRYWMCTDSGWPRRSAERWSWRGSSTTYGGVHQRRPYPVRAVSSAVAANVADDELRAGGGEARVRLVSPWLPPGAPPPWLLPRAVSPWLSY
ncbi:unnamed protein product [Urochloa humidicola]